MYLTSKRLLAAGVALVGAAVLSLGGLLVGGVRVQAANSEYGSCQPVSLPVSLSAGLPADQKLSGTLCTPLDWAEGAHQIDVMVSGGSYNRTYWDWPVKPAIYSYVDKTLRAGRATLAYDRIGYGASSHPVSALVTVDANAYALHQLIQWASGQGFTQVNAIGHSVGSVVALKEASTYKDVTRLVLTGMLHPIAPLASTVVATDIYPALLDPQFLGKSFDPGYLTTRPGTRQSLFYVPWADPAVVAYDEAHKDTMTSVEFDGALTETELPPILNTTGKGITVPLLIVVGENDALLCGVLAPCSQNQLYVREAPYYSNAADFTVKSIPGTGHSLTLNPTADESFGAINQWLND